MLWSKRLCAVAAVLLITAAALGGCSWDDIARMFYKSGERYCDDNPSECGG